VGLEEQGDTVPVPDMGMVRDMDKVRDMDPDMDMDDKARVCTEGYSKEGYY